MPQFDGREPNLRHQRVFSRIVEWFRNASSPGAEFFARIRKKYFLAFWCEIPQFDGRESNLRHWRVLGCAEMPAPWDLIFRYNISGHYGEECPNSMVKNRIYDTRVFSVAFWVDFEMSAP